MLAHRRFSSDMRYTVWNPIAGRCPAGRGAGLDAAMVGDNPPETVQAVLQALADAPRSHELGGFEQSLDQYRAAFHTGPRRAKQARRASVLASVLGAKLGATLAGVAVGLGAVAVVAYTGPLSSPPSQRTIAATSTPQGASGTTTTTGPPQVKKTSTGPDASGPAAFGLCNAWAHHQKGNGAGKGKSGDAPPFKNLAKAAGGEGKIPAYCAKVQHSAPNRGSDTGNDKSEPSGKPTGRGSVSPTGKPTPLPTPATTTTS